jgi:hypothetical protein
MTRGRVAATAGAAAALLVFAVVVEVVLPAWKARREDARSRLVPDGAPVDDIRLDSAPPPGVTDDVASRSLLIAGGTRGAWKVTDRGTDRTVAADSRAVGMLETALRNARITSVIEPDESALARDEHGIRARGLALAWSSALPEGGLAARKLLLGGVTPDGNGVFAQREDGRIVVLPRVLLDLASEDLDHYRSKLVLDVDPHAVKRVVVERVASHGVSPRVAITRRPPPQRGWAIEEPLADEANEPRVLGLLSKTTPLEAVGFGADDPDEAALVGAGLASPWASLILELEDGGSARLDVGNVVDEKRCWARAGTGPIVQVRSDLRTELLLPDAHWRDNRAVRLPAWRIDNVRLEKRRLEIEIQKEPDGTWRLIKPGDAALAPAEAQRFLDALDDVRCGRFEDALAATPGALDQRFDFDAPGSFRMRGSATLEDGTPVRVDVEATPFTHARTPYFGVRALDQEGGTFACVVSPKPIDKLLKQARVLAAFAGGAPPKEPGDGEATDDAPAAGAPSPP